MKEVLLKLRKKYENKLKSIKKEQIKLNDIRSTQTQLTQMTSDYQMGAILGQKKCLIQAIKEIDKLIAIL